jgi:hypothetical protein
MDEAYRLLAMQQTLEKEAEPGVGLHVVGLSVNDTISVLLKAGLARKADRVRADFKVPDRRCVPSETDPLRAAASLTLESLSLIPFTTTAPASTLSSSKRSPRPRTGPRSRPLPRRARARSATSRL